MNYAIYVSILLMFVISTYNGASHLGKQVEDLFHELLVEHFENTVNAADHIGLGKFIRLFECSLLELDNELLIHSKNGNLAFGVW